MKQQYEPQNDYKLLIFQALEKRQFVRLKHLMASVFSAQDLARLIESSKAHQQGIIWLLLSAQKRSEVLPFLAESIAAEFLEHTDQQELSFYFQEMDEDDVVDLMEHIPEALLEEALAHMDSKRLARIRAMQAYDSDSAGGMMNTDFIAIGDDVSVDVVLRYIRRFEPPEDTDRVFVVNENFKLLGYIPLVKLITSTGETLTRDIVLQEAYEFHVNETTEAIAHVFESKDLLSAPVVNDKGILLGRITIDDVVDLIRQQEENSVRRLAKLKKDDSLFIPLRSSFFKRTLSLGVNLMGAMFISSVIGLFTPVLDQLIVLAVLMPVIASMGGISSVQTFTLVVRALSMGYFVERFRLIMREMVIGLFNGFILGSLISLVVVWKTGDVMVAAVFSIAMMVSMMINCTIGAAIPLIFRYFKTDPIVSGSVLLAFLVDLFSYVIFLGLATLGLSLTSVF